MVKKKHVSGMSNRLLYTLIAIGILAIVATGVYALVYNVPNPGHSVAELQKCDSDGQVLKMSGGNWVCGVDDTGTGGTSLWKGQDGGPIYYNGGDVGIGTSSPRGKFDISLGSTSQCVGIATSCSSFGTSNSCQAQTDCNWVFGEEGEAAVCESLSIKSDCDMAATWWGCSWSSEANTCSGNYCEGIATSCSSFGTSNSCQAQAGCNWETTLLSSLLVSNAGIVNISKTLNLEEGLNVKGNVEVAGTFFSLADNFFNIEKKTFFNYNYIELSSPNPIHIRSGTNFLSILDAGINLPYSGISPPACGSTKRGFVWFGRMGGNSADELYICRYSGSAPGGFYEWKRISYT